MSVLPMGFCVLARAFADVGVGILSSLDGFEVVWDKKAVCLSGGTPRGRYLWWDEVIRWSSFWSIR